MKVGRPLKFKTVEELIAKIDEYFKVIPKEEWTITGLAIALDTSRETLCNYEDKEEFFDTIKKAKDFVEHSYELDLKKHGRTGTIFALKNFDWKDKNETDITTGGDKIIPILNVQPNNSDKQDSGNEAKGTDSAGGDIGVKDNINPIVPDSDGTVGQEANPN